MKVTTYINIFSKKTLALLFLVCLCSQIYAQGSSASLTKVVIDAGHGGKDPGTTFGKTYEKDITLKVAKYLGEMIKDNLKDVKVYYTRETDVYVGLAERGNLANKLEADLFISIHVDASTSTKATGTTTYVMGMDKSNANLEVAMRENDIIKLEDDYTTKYEGYIPGSTESFIIFTLMQYAHVDQSMNFANILQSHYKKNTPMPDRGARQAPYLVLWKTAMPSVLTEIGFMSNSSDRAFLSTSSGQKKVARALFNAFSEYKTQVDGRSNPVYLDENYQNRTKNNTPATKQKTKNNVYFSIQLCSSPKKVSINDAGTFKSYKGKVTERKVGKLYKYYYGKCYSYSEAMALQNTVRKTIKGAFAVGIIDEKVVSVQDARAKLK
ncbi:MAG: N-acetylmuramoyl-L-alanine amidase [Rikenellaceae bacterium]